MRKLHRPTRIDLSLRKAAKIDALSSISQAAQLAQPEINSYITQCEPLLAACALA